MFCLCCKLFLAPWMDLNNIESPIELHEAVMGVSTLALVLGLIDAALAMGTYVIWKKSR